MEQFIILLLIALISIINWLVQKSKEKREARKLAKHVDATGEIAKEEEQAQPPEAEGEITMRRLREALGLPEKAAPPALPKRVEELPPERPLPPLPRPARRPVVLHVPSVRPREGRRAFELPHRLGESIERAAAPRPPSRIRELLGSAGGLRDAVVLSEILGPPKGFRQSQFPS